MDLVKTVEKLLSNSDDQAAAVAAKQLLLLSVFPAAFSPWAAAHVLGLSNVHYSWHINYEVMPLLQLLLPGAVNKEDAADVMQQRYAVRKDLRPPLRALLAQRPVLQEGAMLRYVECVAHKVLQDHKCKDQQEAHCLEVAYVLDLVASGQLPAVVLNTWRDGELGMSLCRCMDIMCPPLKVHPRAEAALKLLLEHPHDACCPFCIFHLYPTLHAQGKLREMDEWLALIPLRTPLQPGGDIAPYHGVDINLDYLTSKAYSLLLQGRGQEAEALTRRALALSKQPWQLLNNSNNLVFALRQQGKLQEALVASAVVLEMLTHDEVELRFRSESLLAVGLVQRDLGQLGAAEATLLQAVATARLLDDDKDVDDMRLYTCYHASKVLLQQHDKVKAASAVELAVEAQQHAARWCLPGHPLPARLQVLLVDTVIALFTLPAGGSPPAPHAAAATGAAPAPAQALPSSSNSSSSSMVAAVCSLAPLPGTAFAAAQPAGAVLVSGQPGGGAALQPLGDAPLPASPHSAPLAADGTSALSEPQLLHW